MLLLLPFFFIYAPVKFNWMTFVWRRLFKCKCAIVVAFNCEKDSAKNCVTLQPIMFSYHLINQPTNSMIVTTHMLHHDVSRWPQKPKQSMTHAEVFAYITASFFSISENGAEHEKRPAQKRATSCAIFSSRHSQTIAFTSLTANRLYVKGKSNMNKLRVIKARNISVLLTF